MAERRSSFFSFARRPRVADDDSDDEYVVSLRGILEHAPVNAADSGSVFRAETALKAEEISGGIVIPQPSTGAYSPYAEKWKEFDKLQKLAKGNHAAWFHWIWGMLLPALGLLDRHRLSKKDVVWLLALGAAVGGVGLLRAQQAKNRFLHWPCPRCGAEWPGTKTEKEPKCATCGLKLHQMAP